MKRSLVSLPTCSDIPPAILKIKIIRIQPCILQCFRDGDEMEHAEPLPQFSDLLREEYLWSEEYDEEADEMRYEEDEVFPADEFYSFYYDSWQSVEAYRDILEQVPAEFAKPAAAVLELL